MPNVIDLDFRGITPAGRSSNSTHIPEGRYRFRVGNLEQTKTNDQKKKMIVLTAEVASGEYRGKALVDRFAIPLKGDSEFPLQRLLAFFTACQINAMGKKGGFDLDRLKNKTFEAWVEDEVQEERYDARTDRTYPAYTRSKITEYLFGEREKDADEDDDDDDEEEAPRARTNGAAKLQAVAVNEDGDEDEEEDDDEDEDDTPPPPARRQRSAPAKEEAPVAAPAGRGRRTQPAAAVDEDLDDLFG